MTAGERITKSERLELAKVVRANSRVARSMVEDRKAELLAGVEEQLAAVYQFDDDHWSEITKAAEDAVRAADEQVARTCRDLGIPARFAPRLTIAWYGRGENALAQRRAELRRVGYTKVEAQAKKAKVEIERVEAQMVTELVAAGISTDAAAAFLNRIPDPAQLMPAISLAELEQAPGRSA